MKGNFFTILLFLSAMYNITFAQIDIGQLDPRIELYRKEPLGNSQYERQGTMVGNRINTLFFNYGEVAYWQFAP